MRVFLLSVALLSLLIAFGDVFVAAYSTRVLSPIRAKPHEYAFNLSSRVWKAISRVRLFFLSPVGLLLLDVFWHRQEAVASALDKLVLTLLAVILVAYGVGLDLFILVTDTNFLRGVLPNGFVFLALDLLLVVVPPALLILSLLGHDYRTAFLLSLPVLVLASLAMKGGYGISNFRI